MPPEPRPGAEPVARPAAVVALAVLLLVEAVAVAGAAAVGVPSVVTGGRPAVAGFVVLCALGVAAALVASARSFWRGSSRARGPAATWQLLQGATALTLLQAGVLRPVAWAALAVAAAVLALVVTRPAPPPRTL
ncbi:hypothetical protein [Actinotalea solisilvae]|uniref:hypothetical protein n=1 Tax=Actinotalea solisilvae TaxID=2072922 RepID=UPI0018F172C1|nr:hypothetical protein [Actinotalea solisilvae]